MADKVPSFLVMCAGVIAVGWPRQQTSFLAPNAVTNTRAGQNVLYVVQIPVKRCDCVWPLCLIAKLN